MSTEINYNFSYSDASIINLSTGKVGFFLNLNAAIGDSLVSVIYTSGIHSDSLVIEINKSNQPTPQTLSICCMNNTEGYAPGILSNDVYVKVLDSQNNTSLYCTTLTYQQGNSANLTTEYEVNYVSAPYKMYPNNNTGGGSAYVIVNLLMSPNDTANIEKSNSPGIYDVVVEQGDSGTPISTTVVGGPFSLDTIDIENGVQCQTVIKKNGIKIKTVSSPVAIKHYGTGGNPFAPKDHGEK